MTSYTQPNAYVKYIKRADPGQFASQTIETW